MKVTGLAGSWFRSTVDVAGANPWLPGKRMLHALTNPSRVRIILKCRALERLKAEVGLIRLPLWELSGFISEAELREKAFIL